MASTELTRPCAVRDFIAGDSSSVADPEGGRGSGSNESWESRLLRGGLTTPLLFVFVGEEGGGGKSVFFSSFLTGADGGFDTTFFDGFELVTGPALKGVANSFFFDSSAARERLPEGAEGGGRISFPAFVRGETGEEGGLMGARVDPLGGGGNGGSAHEGEREREGKKTNVRGTNKQ